MALLRALILRGCRFQPWFSSFFRLGLSLRSDSPVRVSRWWFYMIRSSIASATSHETTNTT